MERTTMGSRRVLLAGLAAGVAAPMLATGASQARAADESEAVGRRLEALRAAIVEGDAKALDALTTRS
ncbi:MULTISPECIES: hypothetical protein [Methylobacterium]|nr:hypothetical protein [Methylobacterium aquaticum]